MIPHVVSRRRFKVVVRKWRNEFQVTSQKLTELLTVHDGQADDSFLTVAEITSFPLFVLD